MLTHTQPVFSPGEKQITIEGAMGGIQTIISCPEVRQGQDILVVCHPHSLQGGTLHNKVVTTLARTFRGLGICSVRFNFRGVGETEGEYDGGIGESDDLLTVLKWLIQHKPDATILLAGFSFGAYVAYRAASQWSMKRPIKLLIQVAPPVNHYDFDTLTKPPCPHFVLQGDQDEVVPAQEVYAWVDRMQPKPELIRFPKASHFFHGMLIELKSQIIHRIAPVL